MGEELDTDWLKVGHVDEIVAFVPLAEGGFRLVLPDIDRTWDLRGESPTAAVRAAREGRPETMPVWFDVPDQTSRYVAVGDSRIRWCKPPACFLQPGRLHHSAEDEAVRLPVLFCSDGGGGAVAALAPNPVNLVCCGREVVLLDPFGPRESPADESTDVFRRAWTLALRRCGARPVFLDGWDSLHRLDGGARCGTNVLRKP